MPYADDPSVSEMSLFISPSAYGGESSPSKGNSGFVPPSMVIDLKPKR